MAYVLYADGIHDDTAALAAWYEGGDVRWADGALAIRDATHPDNPMSGSRGPVFTLQNNCPCGVFHPWRDDDVEHVEYWRRQRGN